MDFKMKKLYHGAAYYPELWDAGLIDEDIRLMGEAGINMARIGEFWWACVEPYQGDFRTDWIVEILDKLHKAGIDVCMCTPTPTPPIWLTFGHEERLHINANGQTMIHGSRQQCCTNNPEYRALSLLVIDKIAAAVASHHAVVLWQLDNEFKCHIRECFCDICKGQWHDWLKAKYGSIENLNDAWGSQIWSQWYQNFEQIPVPLLATPFRHNASMTTMYKVFHREKIAEFAAQQAEVLRKYTKTPICTNGGMGFGVDNEVMFQNLDMVAYSSYSPQDTFHAWIMNCDIWRGIKKDRPFWNLETTAAHTGAIDRLATPHPNGYLVPELVAVFALGGAGFTYWLWRQQRTGCEISHSAVISAWGAPGVGWDNVLAARAAMDEISPFILATEPTPAECVLTYSDRARVMMETENHRYNDYRGLSTELFKIILEAGLHRDLLPENQNIDGAKLLITPFMMHMSKSYFERAKAFVEAGGVWIIGPATGGRTEHHTVTTDNALGGEIEAFAGVTARNTYSIDKSGAIGEAFGESAELTMWSSDFVLHDAAALGHMRGGLTPDKPFITEVSRGKGRVIMMGSQPIGESGQAIWHKLLAHAANAAGISRTQATPGTVVIPRKDANHQYLVICNMDGKGGEVTLPSVGHEMRSKTDIGNKLTIAPFDWKIVRLG